MKANDKAAETWESQAASRGNEQHNDNRFKSLLKTIIFRLAQRELLSPNLAYWLINTLGLRNT